MRLYLDAIESDMRKRRISDAVMLRMSQAEGKEGAQQWGKYMRTIRQKKATE